MSASALPSASCCLARTLAGSSLAAWSSSPCAARASAIGPLCTSCAAGLSMPAASVFWRAAATSLSSDTLPSGTGSGTAAFALIEAVAVAAGWGGIGAPCCAGAGAGLVAMAP